MTIKKHTHTQTNLHRQAGLLSYFSYSREENEKWKKNKRVERRERERDKGGAVAGLILTLQPVIGLYIDRTPSQCFQICHKHSPWQYLWLAGFLITLHKLLVLCPCPHYSGRRYSQAENEHGTMPFILTEGVTLSWVRDECARLSAFNRNTTRDVKLTYLSGRRGHLVWEQPCCVMRLVRVHIVRTSVILMCNNSSNNRPWHIVPIWNWHWKKGTFKNIRCHF